MRNNVLVLLCTICILLPACKKKSPYRIPSYEQTEEKITETHVPIPVAQDFFPDREKVIQLLLKYVEYKEACNYDSLAILYAPNVEQYIDKSNLSRNDVVYYYRRMLEDNGIRNVKISVLWNTMITEHLASNKARVTFMAYIDYMNHTHHYAHHHMRLLINEDYLIISENNEIFNNEMGAEMEWDYSPVDETIELQDKILPYDTDDYKIGTIDIPLGSTIQEAMYNAMPNLRTHEKKYDVGGAKLIGEMSADMDGIYTSKNIPSSSLRIRPLNELKLTKSISPWNLYNMICSDSLRVVDCKINSPYNDNGRVIYIGQIPDRADVFKVDVTLYNPTNTSIDAVIPEGSMIEVEKNDVQNVVISEEEVITILPHQKQTISLKAVCGAKNRKDPTGAKAKITPYILTSPNNDRYTQESIWQHQSVRPRNRLVFYAWGREILHNGHKSDTGHAFAYVPYIGYIGFGVKYNDQEMEILRKYKLIAGTDGVIFDHSRQHQLATDSCEIYITDEQLSAVIFFIQDYMVYTPPYRLGRYDCTSFVMDIADAADIYYGNRLFIQTPVGFMQELKKHNYN